jgi:tetratricopeptide (TPR) repeat protein
MAEFDKLWNYGDPAATEQKFRELLTQARVGNDAEYLAQLLTQIARTQSLQANFPAAHETLDEVERMIAEHPLGLARVRYLLERGRAYNGIPGGVSGGAPEKAMALFEEAYLVASELGEHRYAVDALHMIAIVEPDATMQVDWNLKAIAYAERTNEVGWLFALYNNIGESFLLLQQYEQAYDYFSRLTALQRERRGSEDMYTVKDKAKAARLAGRAAESLDLILPVLDKLLTSNSDDGYIRQEYAEALFALGEPASAKPHFAKAYELLSQDAWAVEHEPLERIRSLSL